MKKNQLNLHKLLHDKSYLSAFTSLYSLEYYESHHILKIDSNLEELFADSDIHWIQNPKHIHGFIPEKNHWNFCNGKTPTVYPNGIILEQNHKIYYTNRIVCSGMYIDFDTLYDSSNHPQPYFYIPEPDIGGLFMDYELIYNDTSLMFIMYDDKDGTYFGYVNDMISGKVLTYVIAKVSEHDIIQILHNTKSIKEIVKKSDKVICLDFTKQKNEKDWHSSYKIVKGSDLPDDKIIDEDFGWNKDDVDDYVSHLKEKGKWEVGGEHCEN